MRTIIAFVLFVAVFAAQAEDSTNTMSSETAYARWTKSWADRPVTNSIPGGTGLKAVVTIVKGEAPLSVTTNMTPVQRLYLAYQMKVIGSEIDTNGSCRCYIASNTGSQTVPARQLSPDQIKHLNALLTNLPDDNMKLPPPGQRIVVQVLDKDHWRIRVYDGTAMPPDIHSLLALIDNPFNRTH